jgi:hypothetical protein
MTGDTRHGETSQQGDIRKALDGFYHKPINFRRLPPTADFPGIWV